MMMVTANTFSSTSSTLADPPAFLSSDVGPRVGRRHHHHRQSIRYRKKRFHPVLFSILEEHVTLDGPIRSTGTCRVAGGSLGRAKYYRMSAPAPFLQLGPPLALEQPAEHPTHPPLPHLLPTTSLSHSPISCVPSNQRKKMKEMALPLEKSPTAAPVYVEQDRPVQPRRRLRGFFFRQVRVLPLRTSTTLQENESMKPETNLDDYCQALIRIKEKQNDKKKKNRGLVGISSSSSSTPSQNEDKNFLFWFVAELLEPK